MINIKRIYEAPGEADGYRVLVDRLWPRGVAKDHAKIDVWLKEVAPSAELREWFGHDPDKFKEFTKRYTAELKHNPAVEELSGLVKKHPNLTLLYGAKDVVNNQAVVLREYMQNL